MAKKSNPKKIKIPDSSENLIKSNAKFPIVGIGASAGGLKALNQFFSNMPSDTGMAFVVIQHLDPTHVGMLPELLQRFTAMQVQEAKDGMIVKQNSVYVIPPNKSLSVSDERLHLFVPIESHGVRLPIDFFLESLAIDYLEKSIAVILSGMGSDGSKGLKLIKEKNGMVLVQEPRSATFDSMPLSAIQAVKADLVAPADELPAKLLALLNLVPADYKQKVFDEKNNGDLDKIINLLLERSNHDFSLYKKNTLIRRIERRKGIHKIEKISTYADFLNENPAELDILFKELLIGVTSFFRDAEVWEKLKDEIIPELIKNVPNRYVFRAWVTACSSGEEAYTLAMIFKEVVEKFANQKVISLQIFATDLDRDAIEKARVGIFSLAISQNISRERLSRFFVLETNGYRIKSSIREMVIFAPHDIIKDPPFTKLDILTCRNMLIYMESELQKKLFSLFNYSLNQDGILVLGSAETLGDSTEGFMEIDAKLKLYKRTSAVELSLHSNFPTALHRKESFNSGKKLTSMKSDTIQAITDQILLQRFTPPSVLVNQKGDIIYITGRTGKYLEPAAGKANMNIYAMMREGANLLVSEALRKAMKDFSPVFVNNLEVSNNGSLNYVNVTVQRLEAPEVVHGLILIVFMDVKGSVEKGPSNGRVSKSISSSKLKELEDQLSRSRAELQIKFEEMQIANEEYQSTIEELQSANEELTTSKEEMQSMNEGLQTMNVALQSKINDYIRVSDDMKNLLDSADIATLFLDEDLNIRRFTNHIQNIVNIRERDIGRPLTDLATSLKYPEIEDDFKLVLKTLNSIKKLISTKDDRWYTMHIMPYCTIDDKIDGLVITFIDNTEKVNLEKELKALKDSIQKNNSDKK
jgi:two-component system, chemotaxis family, CheB/CheR fusion protein